jgi:uncharacterized protein
MTRAGDAHESDVEAWRSTRYASLRQDVGWLTLAGLTWLKPGANLVGSDPSSDVVLPAGPERAGTLEVAGGVVTADGAFRHEGQPAVGLALANNADGEPTMLELGRLRLCVIERGGRLGARIWDLDAPTRRAFAGVDHWPVDPAWRFDARFEPTPGRMLPVADAVGDVENEASPGDVVFELDGAEQRLQALVGGNAGELWIVFGDATNRGETYGGGRFLYTPAPAAGRVVVDFNRAYNPPCVFSPFTTCPLPWPENRLPIRVEAGERMWRRPA